MKENNNYKEINLFPRVKINTDQLIQDKLKNMKSPLLSESTTMSLKRFQHLIL